MIVDDKNKLMQQKNDIYYTFLCNKFKFKIGLFTALKFYIADKINVLVNTVL